MSKKCTLLWREAHSKSKCTKHSRSGPCLEVEMSKKCTRLWREAHSEKAKNTSRSESFWKLRCRKSARPCGAKHMSKSKCYKAHQVFGPLLEVEMSKKSHAIVARSTLSHLVKMWAKNTRGSDHFWTFRCTFRVAGARDCGHLSKVRQTWRFVAFSTTTTTTFTLHSNTLHYNYNYTFTTFHYTTLHSTTLHYTTQLHYNYTHITLRYNTFHYTTLHYTTLHSTTTTTTLHLHYTTLHSTTLHSTTLHYTPLHSITLHLHYIRRHYTTFHYTTLH